MYRDFDKNRVVNALGIVFSQLCGTMQAHLEGSPLLGMQMGFNARNAIISCDIAAHGIPAPKDVFEGKFGYYQLFEEDHNLPKILPSLGKKWRINEISHKPFPSGRATHGIIDACLIARKKNNLHFKSIKSVEAKVPSLVHLLVGRPAKSNMETNYARLCAQFTAARVLISGRLIASDFLINRINDFQTLELAHKIHLTVDNNPDPNTLTPITVTIKLNDGDTVCEKIMDVYGSVSKPMVKDQWQKKFITNWSLAADKLKYNDCHEVIKRIDRLENEQKIAGLINKLTIPTSDTY